jgi:hypothetical protein
MNTPDRMPFTRRLSFFALHVAVTAFFFLFTELLHASEYLQEGLSSKGLWLLLLDEATTIGMISAGYVLLLTLISFRMKRAQRSGWLLATVAPPLMFIFLATVYMVYESDGVFDSSFWAPFICSSLIVVYSIFMRNFYERNKTSLSEEINSINAAVSHE